MSAVTLARNAMATRFEVVLHGENASALRAAGEEALDEIERLEARLSLFQPASEIAHLNARAAKGPVRVTPALFALLERAKKLHEESGGAFDITVGPLVRCWGFMGGAGHRPEPATLAAARATVGMGLVELEPKDLTVHFARPGVLLDLGAIGKGYAIERAAEILREAGVTSALLHGGTSTVYALGRPPEAESWNVAIEDPKNRAGSHRVPDSVSGQESPTTGDASLPAPAGKRDRVTSPPVPAPANVLATVPLRDEALSVSAVWGKFFEIDGKTFGHVLDPRTGQPAGGAVLAAVVLPSATETDALSTALLLHGAEGHEAIWRLRRGMRTLLARDAEGQLRLEAKGIRLERDPASARPA